MSKHGGVTEGVGQFVWVAVFVNQSVVKIRLVSLITRLRHSLEVKMVRRPVTDTRNSCYSK